VPSEGRGGLTISLQREESGSGTVEELVDLDLTKTTGVLGEGKSVPVVNLKVRIYSCSKRISRIRRQCGNARTGCIIRIASVRIQSNTSSLVVAQNTSSRNDVVGQRLEGGGNLVASRKDIDRAGLPIFSHGIVKDQRVVADNNLVCDASAWFLSVELYGPVSNSCVLLVIVVKRIDTEFANTLRAVRAGITLIAVAAHCRILVPKVVNVVVVLGSDLLDGLAGSVTRAGKSSSDRAVCSLACRAVVAFEALAVAGAAVADTLVGALSVLVGRVRLDGGVGINHSRVLFGSSLGVHGIVNGNISGRAR